MYSKEYSKAYHKLMNGLVERQMRKSIHLTSSNLEMVTNEAIKLSKNLSST